MRCITGDDLFQFEHFLSDGDARQPFQKLCAWLLRRTGTCVLQSPGCVGETELLHQGVRYLLEQGVGAGSIAWICGEPDDSFDDLSLTLQEYPDLRYLFVDRAGHFSYILGAGDFLQRYAGDGTRKLVLGGQSLLASYLLARWTLQNRCEIIRLPFLSCAGHCRLVLKQGGPNEKSLLDYQHRGGLLIPSVDAEEYLRQYWALPIARLYENQMERDTYVWLKPAAHDLDEAGDTDWMDYLTAILRLSGGDTLAAQENIAQEFTDYFSHPDIRIERRRTETTALLELLFHYGVLEEHPAGERMKCRISVPFLQSRYGRGDGAL